MFAVIRTGGKQYKVEPGQYIRIEKLEAKLGDKIEIKDVLFAGPDFFQLNSASVNAIITDHGKAKKVLVFKKKKRKGFRKTKGHRQQFTEIFIEEIKVGSNSEKAKWKPRIVDPEKVKQAKLDWLEGTKKSAKKTTEAAEPTSDKPESKVAKSSEAKKSVKKASKKPSPAKKKTTKKK